MNYNKTLPESDVSAGLCILPVYTAFNGLNVPSGPVLRLRRAEWGGFGGRRGTDSVVCVPSV